MNAIIEVNQLHKAFKEQRVLDGVDFQVMPGSVVGVIGQNGAGKTTLIKTLLGLLKPSAGESRLFTESSWDLSGDSRQKIGYVPQQAELFDWMTVKNFIAYSKSFYRHWNDDKVERLLTEWDICREKKIEKLSGGQKQKLSIILALSHDPELLLLDEPVASMDPTARRRFIKQLIEENLDSGQTIVFSTHITSDIERVAAEVLVLKQGKNYFFGDLDSLKEQVVRLHIQAKEALPQNLPIGGILSSQQSERNASVVVEHANSLDLDKLSQQLNADIRVEHLNLEDIFVELHS